MVSTNGAMLIAFLVRSSYLQRDVHSSLRIQTVLRIFTPRRASRIPSVAAATTLDSDGFGSRRTRHKACYRLECPPSV
ncbi:hypothetical protein B0J14DRAFT_580406 [Halenospora varia]|nr:hypothetical protein B0J14DRAFT_580406 [Halenospora varia]